MSQKLYVNNFEWEKNIDKFDENFIKRSPKIVRLDISLKKMLNILSNYMIYTMTYHFIRSNKDKRQKLVFNLYDKESIFCLYEF